MASYTITECSAEQYHTATQALLQAGRDEPISFLQAPFYGRIQASSGKEVVYWTMHSAKALIGCGLAVAYDAPGGLRFLYAPYGPVSTVWDEGVYEELRVFFAPIALKLNCAFVRLDTDDLSELPHVRPIPAHLARTASLQPRAEWILDITQGEETLWMGLHKHARYNVRLAERAHADLHIYKPSEAPLDTFFSLMQTTSDRDGFGIFDKSFYAAYLQNLSDDEGFVVMCTIDGVPAATGLFVLYDQQAHYVFAGSSDDFRKIAPAYGVIWHAVQEAKSRGCSRFNFGGISDEVKGQQLGGVTGFKKRFGGYAVDHLNPVDVVYKPLLYLLFRLYKTLRT